MPQLKPNKPEPAMKAVRVNSQITEVKQLRPRLILRWVAIQNKLAKFIKFLLIWTILENLANEPGSSLSQDTKNNLGFPKLFLVGMANQPKLPKYR